MLPVSHTESGVVVSRDPHLLKLERYEDRPPSSCWQKRSSGWAWTTLSDVGGSRLDACRGPVVSVKCLRRSCSERQGMCGLTSCSRSVPLRLAGSFACCCPFLSTGCLVPPACGSHIGRRHRTLFVLVGILGRPVAWEAFVYVACASAAGSSLDFTRGIRQPSCGRMEPQCCFRIWDDLLDVLSAWTSADAASCIDPPAVADDWSGRLASWSAAFGVVVPTATRLTAFQSSRLCLIDRLVGKRRPALVCGFRRARAYRPTARPTCL